MGRLVGLLGYAIAPLLFMAALAVASRGEEYFQVPAVEPSPGIWLAADGTYTNLPGLHGGGEQLSIPDRITRSGPAPAITSFYPDVRHRGFHQAAPTYDDCVDVFVGSTAGRFAGGTVCRGDGPIVVEEQRVRRRRSIVTTTDTVMMQDGRELARVRGRSAEHDPGRTIRE